MDEVIVIGHSFNNVDMPYFKEVLNSISENAFWRIFYYENKDEILFKNILIDLGIKEQNLCINNVNDLYL